MSAFAGPVSKATISPSGPSQVTFPTPPQLRTISGRSSPAVIAAWIDRRERRALAAGGDVGRAEVADDVDAERRRGARAVAELPG